MNYFIYTSVVELFIKRKISLETREIAVIGAETATLLFGIVLRIQRQLNIWEYIGKS